MSNIGGAEVFVVLLLALLVLGPERLPKAARQVGNFVRQVRSISTGFQNEIRGAMQEDGPSTPEASRIRPVPAITDRPDGADSGSTGQIPTGHFEELERRRGLLVSLLQIFHGMTRQEANREIDQLSATSDRQPPLVPVVKERRGWWPWRRSG